MASFLLNLRRMPFVKSFFSNNVVRRNIVVSGATRHWYSQDSKFSNSSQFTQSVILLQDGLNIEELPIAIRKANDKLLQLQGSRQTHTNPPAAAAENLVVKNQVMSEVFAKCQRFEEVLATLSDLQTEQVTAVVAYEALARIAEIGQNYEYRNQGCMQTFPRDTNKENGNVSFTLDAILLQLCKTISKSGSATGIISALKLIILPSFPGGLVEGLRKCLAEECLHRVLDNDCTVFEVCDAIRIFAAIPECSGWADKSWPGLMNGTNPTPDGIIEIFKILPHLKDSQRAVFNHVERLLIQECGTGQQLSTMKPQNILNILRVVDQLKLTRYRICLLASRWATLNLHTMDAIEFRQLFVLLYRLDYCNVECVKVLERFFKAQSEQPLDQELMTATANYCRRFRISSTPILNCLIVSFLRHGSDRLEMHTIESVLCTLGSLNYKPPPGCDYEFWTAAEDTLEKKLVQFRPDALLDILINCVRLERFPMNFMPSLFSAHFIHRLHSQQESDMVESSRQKMRLLDAAMTLECDQYGASKVVPKDYQAKRLVRDGRILRACNQLVTPLQQIISEKQQCRLIVTPSVILRDLPLSDLYVVDLLLSPDDQPVHFRYGSNRDGFVEGKNHNTIAILIHPSENYIQYQTNGTMSSSSSKKQLVGHQVMRARHLTNLGFRVLHLELDVLMRLMSNSRRDSSSPLLHIDQLLRPILDEMSFK